MVRRWVSVVAGVFASLSFVACAGGGDSSTPAAQPAPPAAVTSPSTTLPPIEGVQTYTVEAGHSDQPVIYPQMPPAGGIHNPVWQQCTFYDQPVQNEKAVHSLEHGAIWITYRPDLPAAEIAALATLARSRKDIVASRWDDGLPAPVVATAWGRQLPLQSVSDSRLMDFVRRYSNQGPEMNAPC